MSHLTLTGAGKSGAGITATYTVTTTGAQTHTINSFGVSAATVVDWGDGSTSTYNGTALRTHNYAGAGTWLVTIYKPQNVTVFDMRDGKVNLNSADIASMVNVTHVVLTALRSGRFDSADVSAWRPTTFHLYSMPAGYAGRFDSADVSDWRPTNFDLHSMPAGYAGTFDSADVSDWRPTYFLLYSMPAGYAGTFDSADVSAWRPANFYLYSMPAGYAGTFDSADVSAWRPANFYLCSMPAGYSVTAGGGWANWITTTDFQVQSNGLLTATVDAILWELYQATLARTATGGTINVGGTNQAPSGVFQAASACPVSAATSGKEIAHELLNDGCDAIAAGKTWATVTITA